MKKILVIEDDQDIRESMIDWLKDLGYETVGATHGQDGLDLLQGNEPLPQLIIVDLMMPVLDGAGFRRAQLADPRIAGIPVIMMSADGRLHQKLHGVECDAYLNKPLQVDEFLGAIDQQLGKVGAKDSA